MDMNAVVLDVFKDMAYKIFELMDEVGVSEHSLLLSGGNQLDILALGDGELPEALRFVVNDVQQHRILVIEASSSAQFRFLEFPEQGLAQLNKRLYGQMPVGNARVVVDRNGNGLVDSEDTVNILDPEGVIHIDSLSKGAYDFNRGLSETVDPNQVYTAVLETLVTFITGTQTTEGSGEGPQDTSRSL